MLDDSEIAYAKINLALHVRARRDNGYHDLETLFAFVDGGDRLSVEAFKGLSLNIAGPFSACLGVGDDNLVIRAARRLADFAKVTSGAKLTLEKKLPVASGIGGGSADAAATVRLLNRFWQLGLNAKQLETIVAPLGADIPACVQSSTAMGIGTGTDLTEVDGSAVAGLSVLLVNPMRAVSTSAVFAAWDKIDHGPLADGDPLVAAIAGRNDLEAPALILCPEISDILSSLRAFSPIMARMSGSGATCFALFNSDSACQNAKESVFAQWPDYWTMKGRIR